MVYTEIENSIHKEHFWSNTCKIYVKYKLMSCSHTQECHWKGYLYNFQQQLWNILKDANHTISSLRKIKCSMMLVIWERSVKKKKTHLRAVKFLSINQESTFLRNKSCYMHTTWNLFLRNFLHPGCFTHGMETYCNFTTTSLKMSSTRFSVKLVVAGCPSFRSRSDSVIKKILS